MSNKKDKFENFLESFKGIGHDTLIENIKEGFQACFEMMYYWGMSNDTHANLMSGDSDALMSDEEWTIGQPQSQQSMNEWGRGTKWCLVQETNDEGNNDTSEYLGAPNSNANDPKYFDIYLKKGPIFVAINAKTGQSYALHPSTHTYVDANDAPFNPNELGLPTKFVENYLR